MAKDVIIRLGIDYDLDLMCVENKLRLMTAGRVPRSRTNTFLIKGELNGIGKVRENNVG